jgi:ribosomal protein S18 acetylase RimI-like enzyme
VSGGAPTVTLRPAREDDRSFLARVYASTREEELAPLPWTDDQKARFLAQQFDAQTAHYAEHYADASFEVVLVDGEPAGRLIVHRGEGEIRIVDIALLPRFRSRGIGTRLLRPLLDEGTRRGAKVTIHVERFNPALSLYRRLGFAPVAEEGVYLRLERPPGADQAKIAS